MPFNSWRLILTVYLFGVCGTSTVTRIVPLAHNFGVTYGLGAADFGWLVSIVALPALLVALISSLIVERYGTKRTLLTAACVVATCDLGHALAGSLQAVFALRVIEGCAIVQFYTAGPTLLMSATSEPRRTRAMTFWATYMPVGTALGLAVGGGFAELSNWRGVFLAHGALCLITALLGTRLPRDIPPSAARLTLQTQLAGLRLAYRNRALIALSLASFALVGVGIGANLALPLYVSRMQNISVATTSATIAVATLAMFPGSILAGAAITRFGLRGALISIIALLGIAAGTGSFVTDLPPLLAHLSLFLWFLVSGAGMASVLAALPRIVPPERRGSAAALLNQAGAFAVIVNPPLWLKLAATGGWRDFGVLMAVAWTSASLLLFYVTREIRASSKTWH